MIDDPRLVMISSAMQTIVNTFQGVTVLGGEMIDATTYGTQHGNKLIELTFRLEVSPPDEPG